MVVDDGEIPITIVGLSVLLLIVKGTVEFVLVIVMELSPVKELAVPAKTMLLRPVIDVLLDALLITLPESWSVPELLMAPVVVRVVPVIAPPDKVPDPADTEPPVIAPDAVTVVALMGCAPTAAAGSRVIPDCKPLAYSGLAELFEYNRTGAVPVYWMTLPVDGFVPVKSNKLLTINTVAPLVMRMAGVVVEVESLKAKMLRPMLWNSGLDDDKRTRGVVGLTNWVSR